MSHKKFGPDRFSRFDVYWIQTDRHPDRQSDRQAKFIYRFKKVIFLYRLQSNKNLPKETEFFPLTQIFSSLYIYNLVMELTFDTFKLKLVDLIDFIG